MVLSDAVPGLRIEGKPQCHIIAVAKEQDEIAVERRLRAEPCAHRHARDRDDVRDPGGEASPGHRGDRAQRGGRLGRRDLRRGGHAALRVTPLSAGWFFLARCFFALLLRRLEVRVRARLRGP